MTRTAKVLLTLGVLAALTALWFAIAPYYSTIFVWELRKMVPLLAAFAVFIAFVIGGAAAGAGGSGSDGRGFALITLGFVLGGVIGIGWLLHTQYSQDRTYAQAITVTTDQVPTLAPRAPYQVGEAQARPNLGDTAGDIAGTTYLPSEDRYATLVNRRGFLSGYEVALSQQIPLQGRGAAEQKCTFDKGKATDRVSGWWGSNLGREISKEDRYLRFNGDDVYAYCNGDRPMVVVPLKRQVGKFVITERPAGVALYDGKTGALTITTDTANIPGPSYPLSLAAQQREATAGMGGFFDWLFKRSGWETPDDDVNSGNDSEFTLSADGQPVYVTPLTGRGSATAISVVSTVPARHNGLRLAPITIHKTNPVWVSPKAIVDRIKADYQDIPNWQAITVYEVIPTGGNQWVATLGTGQNVLYRATGTGDLKGDKPTCLQRADGSVYRCGTLAGVNGNGVGTQYGADTSGAPASAPVPSGELRGLTDVQLAELQRRVGAEAACRLDKTCKSG
ncbi:hypothetical protein BDK92_7309 [Micromonospora pisi]|uniref:Uncharacterized protein n=1 Tax=Micromonospora pisi TaxID=589240 RepID=A0A495JUY2_9ACTN|nr:hypothetical protein [Micromonospora pisi]RKR92827.1 hypothetical protein BDK92_7309 [Micromonospora pisi]